MNDSDFNSNFTQDSEINEMKFGVCSYVHNASKCPNASKQAYATVTGSLSGCHILTDD